MTASASCGQVTYNAFGTHLMKLLCSNESFTAIHVLRARALTFILSFPHPPTRILFYSAQEDDQLYLEKNPGVYCNHGVCFVWAYTYVFGTHAMKLLCSS